MTRFLLTTFWAVGLLSEEKVGTKSELGFILKKSMKLTFDDELLISKTLLRIAPVPMPPKDGMDVAEMVRGVPSKLCVVNNSFIEHLA